MWNLPSTWLAKFKLQIRYPYTNMDDLLNSYLDIALTNIMTQYLEIPEENIDQSLIDTISADNRVMIATFHVANTLYSNPDINNVNNFGNLIDSDMIYRILGNRIEYFKAYPTATKLDINTQDQLTAFKTDLMNEVNQATASLSDELSSITENNTNFQSQIDTLNTTTTNLTNQVNDLATSNTNLTSQVNDLATSNTNLTNQVNDLNTNLTNQINTLNSDLTTAKTDLTNQINQVNTDLSAKITDLNTANTNLQSSVTDLQSTTTQLNTDLTNLSTDLNNKVNDLTTANTNMQTQIDTISSNYTDLSNQVTTLATNQTQMQTLLNGLNKEMNLTGNLYQISRYSSNNAGLFNCVLQQSFETISSLNILAIVLTFPQTSPNVFFYGTNFKKDATSGNIMIVTSGNYSDMTGTGVGSPYNCKIIYNENSSGN